MRPRAAATSRIIGNASRGISRPVPLVVLRITCVLVLLVHVATWIPIAEAVVSAKRPWNIPPRIRNLPLLETLSTKCFCLRGVDRSYDQAMVWHRERMMNVALIIANAKRNGWWWSSQVDDAWWARWWDRQKRQSSKSVRIGEPEIERALKIMIVTNFHAAHFYTSIGLPLFSEP